MAHVELNKVGFDLPDGRVLLDDVSFRVGDGSVSALVGANGAGKTTLLRIVAGDLAPHRGAVTRTGSLGVMPQFVGGISDGRTVRDILVEVNPARQAFGALDAAELRAMEDASDAAQMHYAQALADFTEAGGYEAEVLFDTCCVQALGVSYEKARWREVGTLSGGEQKRLVLEALLRGPDDVLLLDEPDNYLDVPGKQWLERRLAETAKTVLLISHDRELLANAAERIVAVELGATSNTAWVHGGSFATFGNARRERFARLEELRRRWDEDLAKLRQLVLMYRLKAAYNSGMAARYQAAKTRLRKFEEAGPPTSVPREQRVRMRLTGGRTGKRAVVCEQLELTGLTRPFDTEIWYGERVAVLGANGTGKSHFLRLLAAGGSDPEREHLPVSDVTVAPVRHEGIARLGARIRPGWFAQTHQHPELVGRTLLDVLHRGDEHRPGRGREDAARQLDRYELARAAEQRFETLSGGQQARFQILLLELSGATLLLLDEPTDNLDIASAEALEAGLDVFDGTVLAVTHDRWFARHFDRYLIFTGNGDVTEETEPGWDHARRSSYG